MGIYESLGQQFLQKDLNKFFRALAPEIANGTRPNVARVDGGVAETKRRFWAGAESELDIQLAFPIIHPLKPTVFQVDDHYYEFVAYKNGFLNTFLDAIDGSYCTYSAFGITGDSKIDPKYPDSHPKGWNHPEQCGAYKAPPVISISYGAAEQPYPVNYLRRQCSEFMKLALQGTTIVVSSGDSGVAGNGYCRGKHGSVFQPTFPSGCPYVLSVGSTRLRGGKPPKPGNEVATYLFYSGSGFSNIFPTPKYQKDTVADYLQKTDLTFKSYATKFGQDIPKVGKTDGRFNRAGRAYPDVRLRAHRSLAPDPHQRRAPRSRQGHSRLRQPPCLPAPRALQRCHGWSLGGLQHQWLPDGRWLGSCYRRRYAQLPEAAGVLYELAVIIDHSNTSIEGIPSRLYLYGS
jgi:tripeptidyl-peptidase I